MVSMLSSMDILLEIMQHRIFEVSVARIFAFTPATQAVSEDNCGKTIFLNRLYFVATQLFSCFIKRCVTCFKIKTHRKFYSFL